MKRLKNYRLDFQLIYKHNISYFSTAFLALYFVHDARHFFNVANKSHQNQPLYFSEFILFECMLRYLQLVTAVPSQVHLSTLSPKPTIKQWIYYFLMPHTSHNNIIMYGVSFVFFSHLIKHIVFESKITFLLRIFLITKIK